MTEYEKLMNLIKEKGEAIIPQLLDILQDEDDYSIVEVVKKGLLNFKDASAKKVSERLREIYKYDEVSKKALEVLYLVDILGDIGSKNDVDILYKLLSYYDENGECIIFEALAKLGEGDKVVDAIGSILTEEYEQSIIDTAIMAIAYTNSPRGLRYLNEYYSHKKREKNKDVRELIYSAVNALCSNERCLKEFTAREEFHQLREDIKNWHYSSTNKS